MNKNISTYKVFRKRIDAHGSNHHPNGEELPAWKYKTRAVSSFGIFEQFPDSKVHGANMGPIWGRQDPGGPHVGPMNFAIWGYQKQGSTFTSSPIPTPLNE